MKKVLALMTALMLCLSSMGCATDQNAEKLPAPTGVEDVREPAVQYLQSMQQSVGESSEALGFTLEVFQNMTVGEPFTVYAFDNTGAVISADTYMCPLIYNEQVVGQIGLSYDATSGMYNCSLGSSHAEALHEMLYSQTLDHSAGIVVGQMGDKLFATDGEKVMILFDQPGNMEETAELKTIESLCRTIKENAGK